MPLVSDYPRRRLSAIVEGNAHPSRPQGWRGAGGDLRHWAGQVVEKVRVASVGGRLRFLPWFDPYTDESPEMRAEYRVMLRESSVKAAFQTKVLGVIAEEVQFQADNDDDPREQEGVEFCQYQFRKFRGGAQAVGFSILSGAIIDGHSVCEKVWCPEPIPTGKFRGKRIYHAIKAKDTRYVQLGIDPYRNVTALRGTGFNAGRVWSPSDFVIFSYFSLFENPAGLSDFRAAYRPYWVKDTSWKLRALSLEKWSGPFITGQYTSQEQKEALEAAFDEAKASTWLTVPSGVVVECLDLAMKGTGDFKDAIADCDREILIAIVGAHLQILEGQTGGARGNTKVHKEIGELIQWWLSVTLADVYREQIVVPLMAENYHGVEPPTVTLGAVTDEAMLERGKVYESLQKMGLALSKKAIYRTFNVQPPDPDDRDDLLQPPGQGGPGGGPGGPPQPPGGPAGGGGGQALSERGGWADRRPFAGGADCWPWGFSEAGWYAFASANAGRKVGEKWQGPSGRWFTKRQDNRIVPTSAPDQGAAAGSKPGGKTAPPPAPTPAAKRGKSGAADKKKEKEDAAKAKADEKAKAKAVREKAFDAARLLANDPDSFGPDQANAIGRAILTLPVADLQALQAEMGLKGGGRTKAARIDAIKERARQAVGAAQKAGKIAPPPKPTPAPAPKPAAKPAPALALPEVPELPPMPDLSGAKRLPPPREVPEGHIADRLKGAPHLHEAATQMAALHQRGEALRAGRDRMLDQITDLSARASKETDPARIRQLNDRANQLRGRWREFGEAHEAHVKQCREHLHRVAGLDDEHRAAIGASTFVGGAEPTRGAVTTATEFLAPLLGRGARDQNLMGYTFDLADPGTYGDRAFYRPTEHSINVGRADMPPLDGVHEMGHGIENRMFGSQQAARQFLLHRLAGEQQVKLNSLPGQEGAYADGETGAKDQFDRYFGERGGYYVGKQYMTGDTEIISMGAQALFEDPARFAAVDPEYFAFTLGVLRGELRTPEDPDDPFANI